MKAGHGIRARYRHMRAHRVLDGVGHVELLLLVLLVLLVLLLLLLRLLPPPPPLLLLLTEFWTE